MYAEKLVFPSSPAPPPLPSTFAPLCLWCIAQAVTIANHALREEYWTDALADEHTDHYLRFYSKEDMCEMEEQYPNTCSEHNEALNYSLTPVLTSRGYVHDRCCSSSLCGCYMFWKPVSKAAKKKWKAHEQMIKEHERKKKQKAEEDRIRSPWR